MTERAPADVAAQMIAAEAVPGYDPDDPLAPIKKAAKEAASEELIPGCVAAIIEKMAVFGMDAATRVTVRAYLKREKSLGVGAGDFDAIVEEAKKARYRARASTPSPPHPSAEDAHLHTPPSWASDQDILARVVRTLRVCKGLVGETKNAKLVYLAITSRLLNKQVSAVIKGLSSSGKSYTIECAAALFPPEAVYTMTAMSERALIYLNESLQHRTLILYEATALREGREKSEDNQTAYIVRSLLSEGQIEYPAVVRQEDGSLRTEKLIVPGPTNLVTSTTSISLHPENETRLISLASNDSKSQTRAVLIASSDDDETGEITDLDDWYAYQRWLATANRKVTIPYARCVARQIPPEAVRLRRDWNTVRALIRAHAMMHQARRELDAQDRIIATLDDYAAVRSLVAELVAEGIGATVPTSVRQTVELVRKIAQKQSAERPDEWDGTPQGVTVAAVAQELKLERSAASRRLATAKDKGYLVNVAEGRGKAGRYIVGDPLPGEVVVLPPREKVCTGQCEHLPEGEDAGQDCDCTGVCRCADSADPSRGGDIDAPPPAPAAAAVKAPKSLPSPIPSAGVAHLHTPVQTDAATVTSLPPPKPLHTCTACGEPLDAANVEAGFTTHDSCDRQAAANPAPGPGHCTACRQPLNSFDLAIGLAVCSACQTAGAA